MIFPLGYELTLRSPRSPLPSFIHFCSIQRARKGEQTTCFVGGILNRLRPRPKCLQFFCPLASVSSALSLWTGLVDLCWNAAVLSGQGECWKRGCVVGGVRNDVIWSPQWKGACVGRSGVAFGGLVKERGDKYKKVFNLECVCFGSVLVHMEPSLRVLFIYIK